MILSIKGHVEIEGDIASIAAEMDGLMAAFRYELKKRLGKDEAEATFDTIVENSKTTSEFIATGMVKTIHEISEEGEKGEEMRI